MFKSLRSRLLLSYVAVVFAVLVVIAGALFLISATRSVRLLPALQRLTAIGVGSRQQLLALVSSGGQSNDIARLLEQTSHDQNVRILITNIQTNEVIYDTQGSSNWIGDTIQSVQVVDFLSEQDPNVIIGRFQHDNGSRWLLYTRPFDFDRFQIFFLQREPTAMAYFRQFFVTPIAAAGGVALLVSLLLAYGIARSINRPLSDAADAAQAISEGDYDQELLLQGPEEVQQVASSFNIMAAQVKATNLSQRDFIANVSHDLKTPITSIRGWSQAMLDGLVTSSEEQGRAANIIHSEAERMARMVNQLLVVARLDSGQLQLNKELIDLSQILTDVQRNLQLRAQEKGVHLTIETKPVSPILGDADRLTQVFTNLTDNALTHTPTGGRVHLLVRRHGGQAVEGIVQDTGAGIPREKLPRIFERFYQADESRSSQNRRGSGLGLTIVKELVEAHGGVVQAHSEVDKGTAFVVRLPVSDVPQGSTIVRRADFA
ncbi:MAG: HAMP domain-containing sensor histidine kinase [Chloroflexota bacterium]